MADVTITPVTQTVNTRSGDLVGLGTSVTAGQTWECDIKNRTDELVIFLEEQNAGAATVTFNAGDDPPSKREGMGNLTITLAQADLRMVTLEGARFIQNNGKLEGSVATNTVKLYITRIPRKW